MQDTEQTIAQARQILVDGYDEPQDIEMVKEMDPEQVLREVREMAMEDLAERPNWSLAQHLAEIDWALEHL